MLSQRPVQLTLLRTFAVLLLGHYFGASCAPVIGDVFARVLSQSGGSPWWPVGVIHVDLEDADTAIPGQHNHSHLRWESYDAADLNAALQASEPRKEEHSPLLLSVKIQQRGLSSSILASSPLENVRSPHSAAKRFGKAALLQCQGKDIPWTLEMRIGGDRSHESQRQGEQRIVGAAIYNGAGASAFEKLLRRKRVRGHVACTSNQPGLVLLHLPSASAKSAASVLLPDNVRPRDQEEGSQQEKGKEQHHQPSLLQRYWWFIPLTAAVHLVVSGGFSPSSDTVEGEGRRTSRAHAAPSNIHRSVSGGNRRRT